MRNSVRCYRAVPVSVRVMLALAVYSGLTAFVSANNILLNPGFEEGENTYWTRNAGDLDGTGLGESPRTGSKSWHGAWNFAGSAQTTTYYQDIPMLPGTTTTASMWCKADAFGGAYGNDTHSFRLRIRFRDENGTNLATQTVNSPQPNDTYQELRIENAVAPAGTVACRFLFSYITTQPANAWKVWNIDDCSLDVAGSDQHIIFNIDPIVIASNLNNISATITGARLNGVNSVKLVQGVTELVGGNIVIAVDNKSLTVDLPTTGAPYGKYDLIVEKPGEAPATLYDAFTIRDPSASYLLNGDFEELPISSDRGPNGAIVGWQKWYSGWGGTPAIENIFVDSTEWIHTPKVNGVNTPAFGTYSLRIGEFQENGGEGGVYQQVPVLGGEDLVLAWKWGGGNTMSPEAAVEVAVLDGAYTQGWSYPPEDVLGIYRKNDPVEFGWEDGSISFTVPVDTDTITVYAKVWHNPAPDWNYMAGWFDSMTLLQPNCPDQHDVTNVTPLVSDVNASFDMTVSGSNLDQVTAIRLVRGLDQIAGSINSQNFSTLVAHFDPPPGGATPGDYDVITEQAGCFGQNQMQAFTYECGVATALTGVTPSVLVKPQGLVQLTVSGTNVNALSEVKLVYTPEPRDPPGDRAPYWVPISEAVGAIVDDSDPHNVVMEFDLLNAQAGMYKLVGSRGDACDDPAEVLDVLELQLPTGPNLLTNAGFEDSIIDPWIITPDAGTTAKGDPIPGPELIFGTPPNINDVCDGGAPIVDVNGWAGFTGSGGSWWVGTRSINLDFENWVTPNGGTIEQSVGLPVGPGNYALTATVQVRMWDQTPTGTSLTLYFVVDGEDQPGATASMLDFPMTEDGLDPYTTLSADFIGNSTSDITLKLQVSTNANAGFQTCPEPILSIVGIDDVTLIGTAGCPTPFADADEDGDIDSTDFALVQLCIGDNPLPDECRCFDTDTSGTIDASDLADFMDCATGPDVLHETHPNPNCIEQP